MSGKGRRRFGRDLDGLGGLRGVGIRQLRNEPDKQLSITHRTLDPPFQLKILTLPSLAIIRLNLEGTEDQILCQYVLLAWHSD